MRSEVYSWRVSSDLKMGLERQARLRNISLSALLNEAAREWLRKNGVDIHSEAEQLRLQKAAAECLGAFAGDDPERSTKVRQSVRERLRQRYGR